MIAIKAAGEDSLDAALAYSNAGEAHRTSGHPERALPLFRKARALYERVLGPDHPRVASLLSQEGLIMMNDGFMVSQSKFFAQRLRKEAGADVAAQVERAFALALSRPPTAFEKTHATTFIKGSKDSLAEFCQALLNLNEFVYRL